MAVERTYTVSARGTGKPDYTEKISSGRWRPGMRLEYGQALRTFGITFSDIASPYPYIASALAAGGTDHIIDWSTGLDLPFTVPAGYIYTMIYLTCSMNQDCRAMSYMDTIFTGYMGTKQGGVIDVLAEIQGLSSATLDPTGASAHSFDVVLENLGDDDMMGSFTIWAVLEPVATEPLPTTKTVRCKWCGTLTPNVPQETTYFNCPNCGELNIYLNPTLPRIG